MIAVGFRRLCLVDEMESVVQSSLLAQTLRKEDRVCILSQHTSYIVTEYLEEEVFETHCGRAIYISRQFQRDTL